MRILLSWMSNFFVKYDLFLLSTSVRAGIAVQGPLVIHKLLLFLLTMDRCSSLGHPDAMVGIKQNFLISDNKGIFKITLYLDISVASRDANDLEDLFSGWILLRVLNLASSTIHWCRNYFKEFKKGVSNEQK